MLTGASTSESLASGQLSFHPGRNSSDKRTRWDVARYDRPCSNDRVVSNRYAWQDNGTGTYPHIAAEGHRSRRNPSVIYAIHLVANRRYHRIVSNKDIITKHYAALRHQKAIFADVNMMTKRYVLRTYYSYSGPQPYGHAMTRHRPQQISGPAGLPFVHLPVPQSRGDVCDNGT